MITLDVSVVLILLDGHIRCCCLWLLGKRRLLQSYQVCRFEQGCAALPCTCASASPHAWADPFLVWCNNPAHCTITGTWWCRIYPFTYFLGVGRKRQFRPTTFRDHLSWKTNIFKKKLYKIVPLPTSQAGARGSRQLKQVVVVDIAVVVVLVEVVVDLHLFYLCINLI